MKKKKFIIFLILIFLCVGYFLLRYFSTPDGSTLESREELLRNMPKGTNWNIAVEQELEEYILSGIYSDNGKSGIAVFKPNGHGTYKLISREWRDSDEIIISGFIADGTWYDIVWFNGASTNIAELTYTSEGEKPETLSFETGDMSIICNPAPSDAYSLEVVYYDKNGNKYE